MWHDNEEYVDEEVCVAVGVAVPRGSDLGRAISGRLTVS